MDLESGRLNLCGRSGPCYSEKMFNFYLLSQLSRFLQPAELILTSFLKRAEYAIIIFVPFKTPSHYQPVECCAVTECKVTCCGWVTCLSSLVKATVRVAAGLKWQRCHCACSTNKQILTQRSNISHIEIFSSRRLLRIRADKTADHVKPATTALLLPLHHLFIIKTLKVYVSVLFDSLYDIL